MRRGKKKILQYRRKREGRTNYKKRLKLLASNKLRLVIRKSLKNIISQIVEYGVNGDRVVLGASSEELKKKYNWEFSKNNIPASYLTGLLLGAKAAKKGVKEAVLDIGLDKSIKGGRIYALLKGALDGGLKVPHSGDILPGDNVVRGENIIKYFNLSKSGIIFSRYRGKKNKVEELPKIVDEIKKKILEGK